MGKQQKYPVGAEHYKLFEEIGCGASATVYRAICIPSQETVAVKVLDFEKEKSDVCKIVHEAQTMTLIDHPNLLKAHCSFVADHYLWVVMPFMSAGSCLHIMKSAFPDGLEEKVIATILREVLRGLENIHQHGDIHRDVKAGNIMVDSHGAVKLGDFGVSASLFDAGNRLHGRKTFVGTPCWMAPEVLLQDDDYDFKADIWSFGITALELAHGHAPFSTLSPMKAIVKTIQSAAPGLDYVAGKKFSNSFNQVIAKCLQKDPHNRPSAKELLKHSFFKKARSSEYVACTLLKRLPTLGDGAKELQIREATIVQKKMSDMKKEEIAPYKQGISAWKFDVADLKAQASQLPDDEESIARKDQVECSVTSESERELSCCIGDTVTENAPQNGEEQHNLVEKGEIAIVQQRGRFKVSTEIGH
ncbi:hypothetical protein MKW94_005077 [Papaver nudicaule]|uniref:Protein kinase domain-containing protein n=1 Tax=Papaver nudicaule TaxID=74823 RepID=A0AA41VYC7_PAPNU|nr:hypothetical protein [Papaver nudicaule]